MGQDDLRAGTGRHATIVARLPLEIRLRPVDKELGVGLEPGMVQGGVVGDKVEYQAQTSLTEAAPQAAQGELSTQSPRHFIAGHGETRAADVILDKVGKRARELLPPGSVGARHLAAGHTSPPRAQQIDEIEALSGQSVELRVGNVVQRGRPTRLS